MNGLADVLELEKVGLEKVVEGHWVWEESLVEKCHCRSYRPWAAVIVQAEVECDGSEWHRHDDELHLQRTAEHGTTKSSNFNHCPWQPLSSARNEIPNIHDLESVERSRLIVLYGLPGLTIFTTTSYITIRVGSQGTSH